MYEPLIACPSCQRHVRATEAQCPFCASALPVIEGAPPPVVAPPRLSRAAAFVFGASLAVSACGPEVVDPHASGGSTSGGAGGAGGAAPDGGADDDGGPMPLYGAPPPTDAGMDAPDDDGGTMALYGDPPPIDAGMDAAPDDGGGNQGLYGAPPPPPKMGG